MTPHRLKVPSSSCTQHCFYFYRESSRLEARRKGKEVNWRELFFGFLNKDSQQYYNPAQVTLCPNVKKNNVICCTNAKRKSLTQITHEFKQKSACFVFLPSKLLKAVKLQDNDRSWSPKFIILNAFSQISLLYSSLKNLHKLEEPYASLLKFFST